MNAKKSWDDFKKNKGFYNFFTNTILYFIIIFGIYSIVFLWLRHLDFFSSLRIDDQYYISWLTGLRKTDFLNASVFSAIAFFVWNRLSLLKLSVYHRIKKETIIFASLGILSFITHYIFKFWVSANSPTNVSLVIFVKYGLLLLFFIFTAIAIYSKAFLKDFILKYKKSIIIFILIGIAYFFLIQFFQLIWYSLSYFVGSSISFLLSLSFNHVLFTPGNEFSGPLLGVKGFNVGISNECSGIDSLLLFLSLYVLLLVLDWKRMHVKRMLILLIPGIIGTVIYNIFRIYSLMLVGIFISRDFAVDIFHTNAGWILFLLFFMIFWQMGSKWVYKKSIKKDNKKKEKKKKGKEKKVSKISKSKKAKSKTKTTTKKNIKKTTKR